MKKLVLILAVLNLVGCSESPKQVAAPTQRAKDLPNGSVATATAATMEWPAYSLGADTNSGIYSEPADIVITSRMKKVVTINTVTGAVTYGKGVKPNEAAQEFYAMVGKILKQNCAAKAGAHSEPTGKPDSEKPEKK